MGYSRSSDSPAHAISGHGSSSLGLQKIHSAKGYRAAPAVQVSPYVLILKFCWVFRKKDWASCKGASSWALGIVSGSLIGRSSFHK